MPPNPPSAKKRKHPPSTTDHPSESNPAGAGAGAGSASFGPVAHALKRAKISPSARSILAQSSDKALNKNGDLDVSAFVKAREFEIKALKASMAASKRSLTSRAFQQVPRSLRRRTASHNVKRVPKRLRARAAREVS